MDYKNTKTKISQKRILISAWISEQMQADDLIHSCFGLGHPYASLCFWKESVNELRQFQMHLSASSFAAVLIYYVLALFLYT